MGYIEGKTRIKEVFTDKLGIITLKPANLSDPENGVFDCENNGKLTCEYYIFLKMLNRDTEEDRAFVKEYLNMICVHRNGTRIPGLINRYPYATFELDVVSHDEFNAYCALAKVYGFHKYAIEVVSYGLMNGWCYNNKKPNTQDLRYYRQGRDIAFYMLCAGFKPDFINLIWMLACNVITLYKKKREVPGTSIGAKKGKNGKWYQNNKYQTSGKLLGLVRVFALKDDGFIHKMMYNFYMWRLRRIYGRFAVNEVVKIYYNLKETKVKHGFIDLTESL